MQSQTAAPAVAAAPNAAATIALKPGWNLISLPEAPADTQPASVLAAMRDHYDEVQSYQGCDKTKPQKVYAPNDPSHSDLTAIDHTMGLWLHVTATTTLAITGTQVTSVTLPLCRGWNLIGYPFASARSVQQALASIQGKYLRVFTFDVSDAADPWAVFDPAAPTYANDATVLEPGRGYWVLVTEDVRLAMTAQPGAPPTVSLTNPVEGAQLTSPISLTGSVTATSLVNWAVEYQQQEANSWLPLGSGTGNVQNGTLAHLDPTLLLNGIYQIRLQATDAWGQMAEQRIAVVIDGQQKLGPVTLRFTDIAVDMLGVPLQVVRAYDSRDSRIGDFGVGWRLDVRQGEIKHNRKPGDGWQILRGGGLLKLPCQRVVETLSHLTEVRLSQFEAYRFRLTLVNPVAVLGGCFANAAFEFVDGDYPGAKLDILSGTEVLYLSNTNAVVDSGTLDTYEPTTVRLTTLDGRIIDLDKAFGITRLEDNNGNSLTFTNGGITHSNGKALVFTRDGQNRITQITDPTGATVQYAYDANGDLVRFTDQANQVTRYQYATQFPHHLTTIIGPDGRQIAAWEYNSDGRVTQQCNAASHCVRTEYDLTGHTQTKIDATGRRTEYTYDDHGNITAVKDGLGQVTHYEYDAQGHLLRQIDPDQGVTQYNYDSQGNLLQVVAPHDPNLPAAWFTTSYTYDSKNRPTALTLPTGGQYLHTYDAKGNETKLTDAQGNLLTEYQYDAQGKVILETTPLGHETHVYDAQGNDISGTDQAGVTTKATYDASNHIKTFTDPHGVTATFAYDKFGRETNIDYGNGMTMTYAYNLGPTWTAIHTSSGQTFKRNVNQDGSLAGYVFPNGSQVAYTYDAAGRVTGIREGSGDLTQYDYDAAGRPQAVTSAQGNTVKLSQDPMGRVLTETNTLGYTSTYSYYVGGRLKRYTDALNHTWSYSYGITSTTVTDPLNRQTTTHISPYGLPVETIEPDGKSTKVTYLLNSPALDAEEYPTALTDPAGRVRRFAYNAEGDLIESTDLAGITSTFTYSNHLPTAYMGPTGQTQHFDYDQRDRLVKTVYPDASAKLFAYGNGTKPLTTTFASGATINYTYDGDERLLARHSSSGETQTYTYNQDDLLTQMTDSTGATLAEYNGNGSLARLIQPNGDALAYGYDLLGRIITVTMQLAASNQSYATLYTYDGANNITAVRDPNNGRTTFTYDAANRLSSRTLPNGVTTTWNYNLRDQVTAVVHRNANGVVLAAATYERTGMGEPTKITREDGSYVVLTYDAALRLRKESYFSNTNALLDAIEYTYDAAGNRLARKSSTQTLTYNYASGYKLTSVTDSSGAALENYTYDADGRLTQLTRGSATLNLTFDPFDRLRRVADGSNTTLNEYKYNAQDERTQASGQGGDRHFLVGPTVNSDQTSPYLVANSSGQLAAGYVYIGELPLLRFGPSGPTYYLTDGNGSVIGLADNNGNSVANFKYDGFGNVRTASGAAQNAPVGAGGDFRFHGAWLEASSGFYHMRAREYDPQTGRFLSRDPVSPDSHEAESLHPYLYGYNNPFVYRDTSGRFTLVGLSISLDIQSIRTTMQTMLYRGAVDRAKEIAGDLLASKFLHVIGPLLPVDPTDLFSGGGKTSANPGAKGNVFHNVLGDIICGEANGVSESNIYLEVPIAGNGEPGGNGISCGGRGGGVYRESKMSYPDVLISNWEPRTLRKKPKTPSHRSSLIVELKLNVSNISSGDGQFVSIINHAADYGHWFAAYITAYGSARQAKNRVMSAWASRRVVMVVIILLG